MKLAIALCLAIAIAGCSNNKGSERVIDPTLAKQLYAGEVVYIQYCATCHQNDGSGAAPLNPPLIKTEYVLGDKTELIRILLDGMSGKPVDGKNYNNVMPSFSHLTDTEAANVLTYIRNSFGNKADSVGRVEVARVRREK